MSSITTQQTKLDLELVPKENRIDIGKCNGRIPRGLTPREPTFQVVLDAIALTSCYPAFLFTTNVPEGREFDPLPSEEDTMSFLGELGHSGEINSLNDVVVDHMHQPWRTFAALINRSLSGKTNGLDKLRLSRAQILWESTKSKKNHSPLSYSRKSLSWRNKIGMYTSKDDYLIKSLRFVSAKESSQIYGAILPECLTSPEMKESKAYKTYLGHATGAVPPKIARKFKKASPSKKDSIPFQEDEEPVQKGKRVKRSAKKSLTTPAAGIVFRETPVKTKSTRKEKVDVSRGKGIDLLSEVALTEKAQLKEVRKKSLRDFHKTHHSGSGTVAKKPPSSESKSWGNDEDDNNSEQEASDEASEQENESEEQESDSEQDEESDDDNQEEEEVDQENESEDDEIESDEDKGMDDTTDQFDDDVDARFEEPTQTGKEVVQSEGVDVEMNEAQQGNENLETTQEQVVDDAHVTITTVTKKTEVPVTSSSRSSDLASKFLNFSDIPQTDAEIVSPQDVHVHHEVPRTQAPTLLTIPVSVITESSPVYTNIPQSSQTFTPPQILTTPAPSPTIETTNPLSTLPDFESVF
ncbi:hypothetical protein Tco_0460965 [Tanacetum coccineum]